MTITARGMPPSEDEAGRLGALGRSGLLDPVSDDAYRTVTALMRTVFEAPIAFVSTVDGTLQRYKCSIGFDLRELPRELSFCNGVIATREILAIDDTLLDPHLRDHPLVTGPLAIRSYLGAPLLTPDGYAIGTVCMADTRPRRIDMRQRTIIAEFAALVLDHAELMQIAERDVLTGAWTRRAFFQAASREMARMRRQGRPAAVAVLDLDRFKQINDQRGHRVGDAVLAAVVEACRHLMREEDTLGRLGGEEFAVLFPDTDLAAAERACERLRETIAATSLAAVPDLDFTASFGVAALAPSMTVPEDWIEAADRALYRAKRAGRNCVIAA